MDEQGYQAKVRNTAVPAVYLMLTRFYPEEEYLLALRKNTGYQDGKWELPAGHVDPGELPREAMVREAKEELGISIKPNDLYLKHTSYRPIHDKTGNRIDLVFHTRYWTNKPTICEPDKCAGLRWFLYSALPKNTVPHVRKFIEYSRAEIPFSEFDIEWLKRNGLYQL